MKEGHEPTKTNLTVIVVHSTMHIMHHNDCQITIICGHIPGCLD